MSDIDFVVLWVDSCDSAWQESFAEFKQEYHPGDESAHPARFRDMGVFNYWFRCVENYAPWVRKIHLVTCGQIPPWLDTTNEKLNVVFHKDFIPDEYLPTFNSNAIELNIHRIKGLSDKFVLFNDDTFITSPLKEDFYFKNGHPNDFLIIKKNLPDNKSNIVMNASDFLNLSVINSYFTKGEIMRGAMGKYYSLRYGRRVVKNFFNRKESVFEGFYSRHLPQPFLKSTFEELWGYERLLLEESSRVKFRAPLYVTQYLFRYWQLAKGGFNPTEPKKRGVYFNLTSENINEAIKTLTDGTAQACFNDTEKLTDFIKVTNALKNAFDEILGDKSSFEI